jgi:hypothetical protein
LGFVHAKKQRRDQTRASLRGGQKYKSRNECGFDVEGISLRAAPVKMDLVRGLAFGLPSSARRSISGGFSFPTKPFAPIFPLNQDHFKQV